MDPGWVFRVNELYIIKVYIHTAESSVAKCADVIKSAIKQKS
jgi:hypothetical protein